MISPKLGGYCYTCLKGIIVFGFAPKIPEDDEFWCKSQSCTKNRNRGAAGVGGEKKKPAAPNDGIVAENGAGREKERWVKKVNRPTSAVEEVVCAVYLPNCKNRLRNC